MVRLIRESEDFTDMKTMPSEADVVRAIQKHLSNTIEVRILVSSPQNSVWCSSRSDPTGGYEIRRKDWQSLRSVIAPLPKQDWDAKTLYLVRINTPPLHVVARPCGPVTDRDTNDIYVFQEKLPPRARSAAAVYRFVLSLLKSRKDCAFDAIQDIRPASPSDVQAGSKRAFKGFAFVTLSSQDLVKQLVDDWPWLPGSRSAPGSGGVSPSETTDVTDARKYGVRAITKVRWDQLRDEYLAYRAQLLNAVHEEERKLGTTFQPMFGIAGPVSTLSESNGSSGSAIPQDYPRGCLVFARNIHAETNKTTLRKLFSSAIGSSQDVLDYVDFNKGMDSVRPRRCSSIFHLH